MANEKGKSKRTTAERRKSLEDLVKESLPTRWGSHRPDLPTGKPGGSLLPVEPPPSGGKDKGKGGTESDESEE